MEKEFIPYEQAVALKELGFDEPCFTKFEDYFNKTKLHPIITTLSLNGPYENEYYGYDQKIINDDTKRWFFVGYKNSVKDHNNDILSAPTFSQAFRWFREKYGLTYSIDWMTRNEEHYSGYIVHFRGIEGNKINEDNFIVLNNELPSKGYKVYKTYEESELECLKKLIEIVKNDNRTN